MEYLSLVLSFLSIIFLVYLILKSKPGNSNEFEEVLRNQFQKEFLINREELSKNLQENRKELTRNFERLNETLLKKAKDDRENCEIPSKIFTRAFPKCRDV